MLILSATGNLGADPEVRTTDKGTTVTKFRLGCQTGFGAHRGTTWVSCTMFGDRGKMAAQLLSKGRRITGWGECELRTYTTKQGELKTDLDLIVDKWEFADSSPNRPAPVELEEEPLDLDSIPF